MVSARSVKMGPSVPLTGHSAPVVGSFRMITPEAGEDNGMIDSAVAMLAFSVLFNCATFCETVKLAPLETRFSVKMLGTAFDKLKLPVNVDPVIVGSVDEYIRTCDTFGACDCPLAI